AGGGDARAGRRDRRRALAGAHGALLIRSRQYPSRRASVSSSGMRGAQPVARRSRPASPTETLAGRQRAGSSRSSGLALEAASSRSSSPPIAIPTPEATL